MMTESLSNFEAILSVAYDFSDWKVTGRSQGTLSNVWRIRTNRGEFALRRSYIRDQARYDEIVTIVESLRRQGLPAAKLEQARDGRRFHAENGSIYSVYEWIPGHDASHVNFAPKGIEMLGECLGQIHSVLNRDRGNIATLRTRKPEDAEQAVAAIRRMLETFAPRATTKKDMLTLQALEYKLRELTTPSYPYLLAREMYHSPHLVHGDFNRGNIILGSEERMIVGLVDLESFQMAPRIWDVGRACAYMFNCGLAEMRAFLTGYNRVIRLTREERSQFCTLLMDYLITTMWVYDEYIERGNLSVDTCGAVEAYKRLKSNQCDLALCLNSL